MATVTNTLFMTLFVAPHWKGLPAPIARLEALRQRHVDAWNLACDGTEVPSVFHTHFSEAEQDLTNSREYADVSSA